MHRVVFADSAKTGPSNGSTQLIVTSPPYFNAPHDYKEYFSDYDEYLGLVSESSRMMYRALADGRIVAVVVDDMLVRGEKYSIVADWISALRRAGLRYRDRITWMKPEGYIRATRRSGVLIQHPYPMYYYPDNLTESILIFQKGHFDYRTATAEQKEQSKIDIADFYKARKGNLNVWHIRNVLPSESVGIAQFPLELAERLIALYSFKGEIVYDPFLGSGTTILAAEHFGRIGVGYEIDQNCRPVIEKKLAGLPVLYEEGAGVWPAEVREVISK